MLTLTSAQEAALNAAGEALADIAAEEGGFRLNLSRAYMKAEGFNAFSNDALPTGDAIWGKGETAAQAVADLFKNVEEARLSPLKLRTAKEAIEAVKGIVADGDYSTTEGLVAKLDKLPVA